MFTTKLLAYRESLGKAFFWAVFLGPPILGIAFGIFANVFLVIVATVFVIGTDIYLRRPHFSSSGGMGEVIITGWLEIWMCVMWVIIALMHHEKLFRVASILWQALMASFGELIS